MLEGLAVILLLSVLLAILVAPILAIVALRRSSAHRRQLGVIEEVVRDLQRRVGVIEAGSGREMAPVAEPAAPASAEAAVEPVPEPVPTVEPGGAPSPAPAPARHVTHPPAPARPTVGLERSVPADAELAVPAAAAAAPSPVAPAAAAQPAAAPPAMPAGATAAPPAAAEAGTPPAVPSAKRPSAAAPAAAPVPPPARPRQPPVPVRPGGQAASARPGMDWERWIGVRGAAALAGVVLALAGIFLFKYSVEQGLISPAVRVMLATVVGVVAMVASQRVYRRGYGAAANALAGGGAVVLYAAVWAAQNLYGLIGALPAFLLMVVVTVACCAVAVARSSLLVAVLGLTGGFMTPLLISGAQVHPAGLFGYILLLDAGLLALARKRRWPSLTLLSLVGTGLHQLLFFGWRMEADQTLFGLAMLVVFAGLFVFAQARQYAAGERLGTLGWLNGAAALLLPFGLALVAIGRGGPRIELLPLAGLLVVLSAGAAWLGRRQGAPVLPLMAALASVTLMGFWWLDGPRPVVGVWPLVVVGWVLTAVFAFFARRRRDDAGRAGQAGQAAAAPSGGPAIASSPIGAPLASALGFSVLLLFVALGSPPFTLWPFVIGWLVLAVFLYSLGLGVAAGSARAQLPLVATALFSLASVAVFEQHGRLAGVGWTTFFAFLLGLGVVLQVIAIGRRRALTEGADESGWRLAEAAAALLPLALLAAFTVGSPAATIGAGAFYAFTLVAGLMVSLIAMRLGSGGWYLIALVATLLAQWAQADRYGRDAALLPLVAGFAAVALFTLLPLVAGDRLRRRAMTWRVAASAGVVWFSSLHWLWGRAFGDGAIGLLPVLLAALALVAVWRLRGFDLEAATRHIGLVWLSAAALLLVAAAVPLQFDRQWITLAWAVQGALLVALWRRLDHPGLKYLALGLLAAATVRLVFNPEVLGYYPVGGLPVLNWLAYTYLVPAAALLFAARGLAPLEVARLRSWERPVLRGQQPVAAVTAVFAAITVVFVWINLAVFHAFSTSSTLTLELARQPARDLTLSLSWALYALVLLAFGVRRQSRALRGVALAFLALTSCKVFLYDLGELTDLYRVASLVGLAVSLLLVSLAYQRFVLGRGDEAGRGDE